MCSEPGTSERVIFTGDTLFVGGCGRNFAGTPQQMYSSLIGTLSKLPHDIKARPGPVLHLLLACAARHCHGTW
jgi:hydroxyacylglutathione hydrolase